VATLVAGPPEYQRTEKNASTYEYDCTGVSRKAELLTETYLSLKVPASARSSRCREQQERSRHLQPIPLLR
jgi:hypothetical protein